MVAPTPTTSQGEPHAALDTVKLSHLKMGIRHLYFPPSSVYIIELQAVENPFEVNGNYYLWETAYIIQYICREKENTCSLS